MQVIIIDPFLSDLSGHNFFYNNALCSELKRRGLPFVVFGNKDARLKMDNFYPQLESITDKVFSNNHPVFLFISLCKAMKSSQKRLNTSFFPEHGFALQQGDILFAHTLYIFELLSLACFLRQKAECFIKKACVIRIGLNFRYIRKSFLMTTFLMLMYKFICNLLLRRLRDRVIYHSDCQMLIPEFEKLLGEKVHFSAMPVYPLDADVSNAPATFKPKEFSDNVTISYIGGARYNKGFDIFVKTIERLQDNKELLKKVFLLVQSDLHTRQQPKHDTKVISGAVIRLESLARVLANICTISGSLSLPDYYRLLLQGDLIIMPYRDETYKVVTSNIFVETVVAGKIPLVSANTWMARELKKYGLGELAFELSPDGIIRVIGLAMNQLNRYQGLMKHMQADYQELYSSKRLVDMLLNEQIGR